MVTNNNLGHLIKEARKIKSKGINALYTQKSLANDVGKSRSYIGDIESGRIIPNNNLLKDIAKACGVEIEFFHAYLEASIVKALQKFPETTLKDVKELFEHDYTAESYIVKKTDPSVELNGYFNKEDILKEYVPEDFPTHKRIRLLMEQKSLSYDELAKIAEVDIKDLLYLSDGIIQLKNPDRKIQDSIIKKVARALDTTEDFLNCKTNMKKTTSVVKEFSEEYEFSVSKAEEILKKEVKSILLLPAASKYFGKDLSVFTEEELEKISYDLMGLLKFLVNRP
jgi:transcriptional regulator with XRE-family HTH domain